MFKRIVTGVLIAILAVTLSVTVFASVSMPDLNSVLTEPDVFYKIENGKKIIQFYQVRYVSSENNYNVTIWTAETLQSNSFYVMLMSNTYQSITCSGEFTAHFERYNLVTGSLIEYQNYTSSLGTSAEWALCYPPDYLYYVQLNMGYNITDAWYNVYPYGLNYGRNSQNTNYTGKMSNEFVIWAPDVPDPVIYKSFMSEPIADPLNKYVIFAGEDHQYLFWINIRCRDFEQLIYSWDIEIDDPNVSDFVTYNEVIKSNSLFTPTIKFIASGQSILSIECNQQLLDWYEQLHSNQSTQIDYIAFECLITKYDLKTGTYIDSVYHSDCRLQSNYIDIDATSFFGSASDYDSIAVYGLNYYNQSDVLHNRLACLWSYDVNFESWRNSMLSLLQGIYEALGHNEEFETETGLNNDVSEYQALESQFMQDKSSEVNVALSQGNAALNNNSFGFIRNTLQATVFDNVKITSFILFALAMGLIVLVLGRKIHL